jgi:hypothetical protein
MLPGEDLGYNAQHGPYRRAEDEAMLAKIRSITDAPTASLWQLNQPTKSSVRFDRGKSNLLSG